LGRIWARVANPGETATLTVQNSRRLFDIHRNRFWRAVREDAAARRLFEDAGCVFPDSPTTASVHTLPNGQQIRMTIDHIIERQTNPGLALDPGNLRVSFERENTQILRLLHAQGPFQQ
jgi:hypothetical protein